MPNMPNTPNEPHDAHDPDHAPQRADQAEQPPEQQTGRRTPPQTGRLERWSPVTEAMRQPNAPRLTKQGNPIDPPDPGTPLSRTLAVMAACLVVLLVVAWQNTPEPTKERLIYGTVTEPEEITAHDPAPGNFGQVDVMGRMFLRAYGVFKDMPVMTWLDPTGIDAPGSGSASNTPSSGSSSNAPGTSTIQPKPSDEDRVRLVMLSAEFVDQDAAIARIESLRADLAGRGELSEPDRLVQDDLDALWTIYHQGPEAVTPEQQLGLGERYGLIGKVALTHGLPDTDPSRRALISGSGPIMVFLVVFGAAIVLGPLMGLAMLIVGTVFFATGRLNLRGHVPARGGSVFLETYALFVGAFIVMAVGTFLVSHSSMPELAGFSLLVQWLLLLTVMWGLVRGMPSHAWRHAIGWHAGEGVMKEIGCGIVGYLACLPLYIMGALVTVVLLLIKEKIRAMFNAGVTPEPTPMVNPIMEIIAHGDLLMVLLLLVLATTWAPIVEEAIFRGALFRHFRGRVHWVWAALGTAILFAYMHDYGPLMVAPLIALGFMFAFMREWRGSLIAPMTAHFLHNFTLMVGMITFIQLIKDPM